MDAERFDALARTLGRGMSRRRALGGLLGGGLGAALGRRAAAQTEPPQECDPNVPPFPPRDPPNCPVCQRCVGPGICEPAEPGFPCGGEEFFGACRCEPDPNQPSPQTVCTPRPGFCFVDGRCVPGGFPNPANPCQFCDPGQSQTSWSNADGRPCNDNDLCTRLDVCQGGACVGTNPVVCQPLDECHVAGECDPATGQCDNPEAPDDTACNADDNACTRNDRCRDGVCVPGDPVVCEAPGTCRLAGTCDPDTGECDNPPAPDGTECDTDDPCSTDGRCVDGECVGTENPCPGKTECCRKPGNHLGQCVARQACANSGNPPHRGGDRGAARQESERARDRGRGGDRKRGRGRKARRGSSRR